MSGTVYTKIVFCCCVLAGAMCGCVSPKKQHHDMRQEPVQAKTVPPCVEMEVESVSAERRAADEKVKALREKSENGWNNESSLRDFALMESPKLWQTIQTIRAQVAARRKGLARLKADLQEFNIKPESDADFSRLQGEIDSLLDGLANVFGNLEQAYVAAKKFELSSASTNHEEVIRRALEDGVKEADNVAKCYHEMTN